MLSWPTLLKNNETLLQQEASSAKLILSQFDSFKNGKSPKIADPEIKAIPIDECNESLVNIDEMQLKRIRMMPSPHNAFGSPNCHSGLPSSPNIRKAVFDRLIIMLAKIDLAARQFGYEPGQISICIFEGLRDLETQKRLFEQKQQEIASQHPDWSADIIYQETACWLSPVVDNIPAHSTGGVIDIRLWDEKKQDYLDMGPFGVIWGSNPNAPTFSEEISAQQKMNRLLLLLVATQSGLVNYAYEFWHFSCHDRYAEYWQKEPAQRKARYSSCKI